MSSRLFNNIHKLKKKMLDFKQNDNCEIKTTRALKKLMFRFANDAAIEVVGNNETR